MGKNGKSQAKLLREAQANIRKNGEPFLPVEMTGEVMEAVLTLIENADENFGGEALDEFFDYLLERQEVLDAAVADRRIAGNEVALQRFLTWQRRQEEANDD